MVAFLLHGYLILGVGGGQRRFKLKQAADRSGHYILFVPLWKLLQFTGQRTGDALRNLVRQGRKRLVLVLREGSEFLAKDFQFLPAKVIETLTQGNNGRHYPLRH